MEISKLNILLTFIVTFAQLANLNYKESKLQQAEESVEQARQVALRNGHYNELRVLNCLMGEIRSSLTFKDFVEGLVASSRQC